MMLVLLFLSVAANAALSLWFVQSTRTLQRLQVQVGMINRQRGAFQAFAADTIEYSRKNPAINPILQMIGVKASVTNGPAPRAGSLKK